MTGEIYLIKLNKKGYVTKSYKEAVKAFLAASDNDDVSVLRTTPNEIIDAIPGGKIKQSVIWKSAYMNDWEPDDEILKRIKSGKTEGIKMEISEEDVKEEEIKEKMEKTGEIDYEAISKENVVGVKKKSKKLDLDYQKLLDAEKRNRNRPSLKNWIKGKIKESKRREFPELKEVEIPEGRLPNNKELQRGIWLYAEPEEPKTEELDTYPTNKSEMISMKPIEGKPTDEDIAEFRESKSDRIKEAREGGMSPVMVRSYGDSISLELA